MDPSLPVPAVRALDGLVPRMGGSIFEIGYTPEDEEIDAGRMAPVVWWCRVTFATGMMIEAGPTPDVAADRMATALLTNGLCTNCGGTGRVVVGPLDVAGRDPGDPFCYWSREDGPAWIRSCDRKAQATKRVSQSSQPGR